MIKNNNKINFIIITKKKNKQFKINNEISYKILYYNIYFSII